LDGDPHIEIRDLIPPVLSPLVQGIHRVAGGDLTVTGEVPLILTDVLVAGILGGMEQQLHHFILILR